MDSVEILFAVFLGAVWLFLGAFVILMYLNGDKRNFNDTFGAFLIVTIVIFFIGIVAVNRNNSSEVACNDTQVKTVELPEQCKSVWGDLQIEGYSNRVKFSNRSKKEIAQVKIWGSELDVTEFSLSVNQTSFLVFSYPFIDKDGSTLNIEYQDKIRTFDFSTCPAM